MLLSLTRVDDLTAKGSKPAIHIASHISCNIIGYDGKLYSLIYTIEHVVVTIGTAITYQLVSPSNKRILQENQVVY